MIDLLDRYLQRLIRESGAEAAVIWSRIGDATAGSVICTHPLGLLPPTAAWPTTDPSLSEVIHRDAAVVASLVPTSMRLELPAHPTAAMSLELADPDLVLLLIWSNPQVGEQLPDDLRLLVNEEISYTARILSRQSRFDREAQRLQAVVGDLKQGVVSVDHSVHQVTVNPAAAKLLNLPSGEVGESAFAAAMAEFEARALNHDDITSMGRRLLADPGEVIDCTWLFDGSPSHVQVSSHAVRQGAFSGRIWVFEDVSEPARALAASQAARTLFQASADSMLDPQVLLEAVRGPDDRIVDFRYLSVNPAVCTYLGMQESDLIGHTQLEASPNLEGSELHQRYIRCVEDGEPVILNDFTFFNEILEDARRYDIRATRAGRDLISLTWSDVTDRFRAAQRIADSEALLRASADSMLNPNVLLETVRDPDGRILDFRYRSANQATYNYLGVSEDDLIGASALATFPNLESSGLLARYANCVETGEPVVLHDFTYFNAILEDDRRYDIQATRAGEDLLSLTWSDVTERFNAAQRIAESEQSYRLLAENIGDVVAIMRDGKFAWVSPSIEGVLGAPPAYWIGREVRDIIPADRLELHAERMQRLAANGVIQERSRVQAVDGRLLWIQLTLKTLKDADGRQDGYTASFRVIDAEVAAEQAAEEARRQQELADARFRRSIDNAAVGMCLVTPEGRLRDVNMAMCQLFGYDADAMNGTYWQDFTAPEYLEEEQNYWDDILGGRIDTYRLVKHYHHAEGHLIWGDLSVSAIRDDNGRLEYCVALITDITALVEADERNRVLAQQLKQQSDLTKAELDSAANYMMSIMPSGLAGAVEVTSRYLPSRELGGDCFDYTWIDDDHLLVYLIDVSGHGLEPALLSVSVHNMLRSGSLGIETLVSPAAAVTELNHLFQMEEQGDHYFTIWYGVYESSTRTLRYVNAGAPTALTFNSPTAEPAEVTELPSTSTPVGMFEEAEFTACSYSVPPGCRMLIYSDGANEITLVDGRQLSAAQFLNAVTPVISSPQASLDDLIADLRALTPDGFFEDDFSMIRLAFD